MADAYYGDELLIGVEDDMVVIDVEEDESSTRLLELSPGTARDFSVALLRQANELR